MTHEEIAQLDCIFEEYEPYGGPLTERKNVSINEDGTIQINKETYHVSKQIIHDLFNEVKTNFGSEKTYKPFLSGGGSSQYVLHLKNGCVIKYSGDYALCDGTPYGCEQYTKMIVDDLLKQI